MSTKMLKVLSVAVAIALLATGQVLGASVLKVWHYQIGEGDALGISWQAAMDEFEALYPDVKIEFEGKIFEQIMQTAMMVLNSPEAPDVMEVGKGNATAGLYSMEGLLTDLTKVAIERGWDNVMSPSVQMSCRYDENGIMGSGNLYAVTNDGNFMVVYYNKEMFEEYGVEVPISLEEFEAVADTFVAAGITPLPLGGLDMWPPFHNWWELVLYEADRNFLNNYHSFQGDVDFQGAALTFGAERFVEHLQRGYYGSNALAVSYDDANAAFIQGIHPMYLTGSWMFSAFMSQITDFEWGIFVMPGKRFNTAASGNIWVVPQNAKNKEAAYNFLSLTLGKKAQTVMANAGGIPLNADLAQVENEKVRELIAAFNTIVEDDGLAFYPDWPVPGYFNVMGAGLQELMGGTMSPAEFNDHIGAFYNENKPSL